MCVNAVPLVRNVAAQRPAGTGCVNSAISTPSRGLDIRSVHTGMNEAVFCTLANAAEG